MEDAEDAEDGGEKLSLGEILFLYDQPINEEQAWAVCYQSCRDFSQNLSSGSNQAEIIRGPEDVWISKDGTVRLERCAGKHHKSEIISDLITRINQFLFICLFWACLFVAYDSHLVLRFNI